MPDHAVAKSVVIIETLLSAFSPIALSILIMFELSGPFIALRQSWNRSELSSVRWSLQLVVSLISSTPPNYAIKMVTTGMSI